MEASRDTLKTDEEPILDSSISLDKSGKITIDEAELISHIEDSRNELEKILVGFKDLNKLDTIRDYLERKKDDSTHLTMEIRTVERILSKEKGDFYHHVFKIHLNAIDIPAYLY